jgi:glutamyl-tRNA reductase
VILRAIGCSYRLTPVEIRERLAFGTEQLARALDELVCLYGCEAIILSTCNRVEVYLARTDSFVAPATPVIAEFLGEFHDMPAGQLIPHLYEHSDVEAQRHLFRVTASLDSMIIGESQIAGQVKQAYEIAQRQNAVGPYLHALFQHALQVSKRVRTETGLARGHVSVSSAAVDYVRQVFDHFRDKTILVIGAGKMGELTLKHLRSLEPGRILVTNRSPDKAVEMARGCGGQAVPWIQLEESIAQADIVLSTTGAPEPIMTRERYRRIRGRRSGRKVVILDIAVPRDFDPRIHDGDGTCLFNIDDLKRIREQTLADRLKHVTAAEAIIEQEVRQFVKEWSRRRHGPVIARLTQDFEAKRQAVVAELLRRLNGKLDDKDRRDIEGAFRLLQNRFLHGPISALAEEPAEGHHRHTLLEALLKLFRLQE